MPTPRLPVHIHAKMPQRSLPGNSFNFRTPDDTLPSFQNLDEPDFAGSASVRATAKLSRKSPIRTTRTLSPYSRQQSHGMILSDRLHRSNVGIVSTIDCAGLLC